MYALPMASYPSPTPSTPTPVHTPVSLPFINDTSVPYSMPLPMSSFPLFSPPLTPTPFQMPAAPVTDDNTLLRLANFVHSTNWDTHFQQQRQQMTVMGSKCDGDRRISDSNIVTMSKVSMLGLIKAQVHSPIVDFLCAVLADSNQFGHVCSFIGSREFKIHNTKTFTELLNLRSRQKPKSYLQVARALKSYEGRVVDGHVMLRKVKDKRNQFKFFPDLP